MAPKDNHITDSPLVSICMPVFNAEKYIGAAIESVLKQTYSNIELIIADDGSKDDTLSIIEGKFTDNRIILCKQQNKGAAAARNLAFLHSHGTFIKFLDADDLINLNAIEKQVNAALRHPGALISGKWGRFYHDDLLTFKLSPESCWKNMDSVPWLLESWTTGQSMTQPGIFLIPRGIIEKVGLWDEKLSLIDDMDFFTRVILEAQKVIFEPESILYYRSGLAGSLSGQKSRAAYQSAFWAIEQSTENLLTISHSPKAKAASANLWQSFVHEIYPLHPELYLAAEHRMKELGGASLQYRCGPATQLLVNLVGWKLTKKIKMTPWINSFSVQRLRARNGKM
jgi:glycosyltransferase involved in cell wall biosynthesis